MHRPTLCSRKERGGGDSPWPSPWRLTTGANAHFRLAPSYPDVLVVPQGVTDAALGAVAAFRSEQRLPTLTWGRRFGGLHAGSIWRSSQPKVGVSRQRCAEDVRCRLNPTPEVCPF